MNHGPLKALIGIATALGTLAATSATARANVDAGLGEGRAIVRALAGCFLVDYSYAEIEALRPGYARDARIYDVNRQQSVKEWIYFEDLGPRRLRLQHVLFSTDLAGAPRAGTFLRHQAEDWEFEAPFLYEFTGTAVWEPRATAPGTWTRRITSLDDGLRYQCAAPWSTNSGGYPEWSCANYAPIPGREFRDMGRHDYQTLERETRILNYGSSWLERQANVKVIDQGQGRTPLAREVGKNWYVRLPDSECAPAREFSAPRQAFWRVLRETWDEVFDGSAPFRERLPVAGEPPRYARVMQLEARYLGRDLSPGTAAHAEARLAILDLIRAYRVQ